jgi:hypothetical protein
VTQGVRRDALGNLGLLGGFAAGDPVEPKYSCGAGIEL